MLRHDHPVDLAEAQEVVRLAAERGSSPTHDGPTVAGLAEALGLAPAEVERLLAEVRNRPTVAEPPAEVSRRSFGDRSAALSAGLALALVLAVGAIGGGYWYTHRPAPGVSDAFVVDDGEGNVVRIGNEGVIVRNAPLPPAPPVAPPMSTAGVTYTQEELSGNAELVRDAAKSLKEPVTALEYPHYRDSISGHREAADAIRQKPPSLRTAGERELLAAVEEYDRALEAASKA